MSSLTAATRPTRRDVARHPWGLLAAVLLIALPIVLFTSTLTWSQSGFLALGALQQRTTATYQGGTCTQSPDGDRADCTGEVDEEVDEETLLNGVLPAGFDAYQYRDLAGVVSHGAAGSDTLVLLAPPVALPPGLDPRTGELPGEGEIMLPRPVTEEIGVRPGDVVELQVPGAQEAVALTVSGVTPGLRALVTDPTPFSWEAGEWDPGWTITGPRPFTWEDVLTLNEAGFTVTSVDVIENPPPPDQVAPGYHTLHPSGSGAWVETVSFLIISASYYLVGLLLLLLLTAPVFSATASRRARTFALMSAQGATPRHIRWAVLTYGAAAGLAGISLGLLLGIGGTIVVWVIRYPGWPFAVPWIDAAVTAGVALTGSLLAAFLPAVMASHAALRATVEGTAPDRLLRWRPWMAVGPLAFLLLGAGWLLTDTLLVDTPAGFSMYIEMLRILLLPLLVLALAASAPALVWLLGRLARGLPLPLRLAGRDAGRRSLHSVPAVAAITAVVFLPMTIFVGQEASEDRHHAVNSSVHPPGLVVVAPSIQSGVELADQTLAPAVAVVRNQLPGAREYPLQGIPWGSGGTMSTLDILVAEQQRCTWDPDLGEFVPPGGGDPETDPAAAAACLSSRRADWAGALSQQVNAQAFVAGPEILDLFVGMDDATRARAAAALAGTGVLTAAGESEGEVEVATVETRYDSFSGQPTESPLASAILPVHAVLPELFPGRVLSPTAAAVLELTPVHLGTAFLTDQELDRSGQERLHSTVEDASFGVALGFTRPSWFSYRTEILIAVIPGAIVLVVVTLISALAAPQIRRQFVLLDAVGADPSLAPRTSAALTGLLTATATVTGVVAGHLAAWILASRRMTDINGAVLQIGEAGFISVHWWSVLVLVVLTPLVAATVGSLFHRRRGEVAYRET